MIRSAPFDGTMVAYNMGLIQPKLMDPVEETFEPRHFCSFCRENYLEQDMRVEQGPGGSICERCLGLCEEVLGDLKASGWPIGTAHRAFCAFCGRRYPEVEGRMAGGPGVSICADCAADLRDRWGPSAVKQTMPRAHS